MTARTQVHSLQVATELFRFVEDKVLPGTGIDADTFWKGLSSLVHELGPRNRELLARRDALQARLDTWHAARTGQPHGSPASAPQRPGNGRQPPVHGIA
jgi:malate synthase